MSLKQDEVRLVEGACGTDKVNSVGVARLYRSKGGNWEFTGRVGAAVMCTDTSTNGVYKVKMIDLRSRQVIFDQEVYFGFKYQELAPFFHCFEVDDCVAGLCFAEESEARKFKQQADSFVRQVEAIAKMNQVTATSAPPLIPQKAEKAKKETRRMSTNKKEKKEKKDKKGGFFSKLFGGGEDTKEEDEFVLSGPSGFRHESHIGWDPSNGFDIRNIPPEWKALFKAAGVKKSELQDAETAQFVMNTVADTLMTQQSAPPAPAPVQAQPAPPMRNHAAPPPPARGNTAPPNMGAGAPPPPPPARDHAPPPPPARQDTPYTPPAAPVGGGAPPPPPPGPPPPAAPGAPPPPAFNAPPAASPVSPAGGGGGGRGGLLDEIHKGTQLKKIDTEALKKGGPLPELGSADKGGLANSLALAMAQRRQAVAVEENDDDEDEWSD